MQLGLVLTIISAFTFAVGIVIIRRASAAAGESFSVTAISILIGMPFFALAVTLTGEWGQVFAAPRQSIVLLSVAGVIHFIIGRFLGYSSFRLIGANKSAPFIQTIPFYTILLSFFFLGEDITGFIIAGVLFMFLGAALTSAEKKTAVGKSQGKPSGNDRNGILLAMGAAVCWGITPILIKPSVAQMGSSVVAVFISYWSALVVLCGLLAGKSLRRQLTQLSFRAFLPMAAAGLLTTTAQLLFYMALEKSPASVVSPLMSIQAVFIFLLSWLVNRRTEVFSWKVAFGILATLVGTYLLFQ